MNIYLPLIYRAILLFVFTAIVTAGMFAQESVDTIPTKKNTISWAPSALVNYYPGIQLGYERILDSRHKFELELAYLTRFSDPNVRDNGDGYRAKFTWKIPLMDNGLDLQINYFHRYFSQTRLREYSRFSNSFNQIIEVDRTTRLNGFAIGITMSENYGLFDVEAGISAGPGRILVDNKNIPEDAEPTDFVLFAVYEESGSYFFPIFSFQLKIKYPF